MGDGQDSPLLADRSGNAQTVFYIPADKSRDGTDLSEPRSPEMIRRVDGRVLRTQRSALIA